VPSQKTTAPKLHHAARGVDELPIHLNSQSFYRRQSIHDTSLPTTYTFAVSTIPPVPAMIATPVGVLCPVAVSIWLRRAARRLACAGSTVFVDRLAISSFLQKERLLGGLHPAFNFFVAQRLEMRFDFTHGVSAVDAAGIYRSCAVTDFDVVMCELDLKHVELAERLELEMEAGGLRTARDVFTAMAITIDAGDRASSHAAQMSRAFASVLPELPAWIVILGGLILAQRIGSTSPSPETSLPASMGALANLMMLHLDAVDEGLVRDGVASTGMAHNRVQMGAALVWKEMLRLAEAKRSEFASTAFTCILHRHHPLPPAPPFHCGDNRCYAHHIGQHAAELHVRASALVKQLRLELEILTPP
jgi:hypothetical protein